ncbi:clavesin-1-like [Ctenocephalides felis]|uniref:clavesin-1-like n=1 Tax=Ctenocephalides felis TaxID=7515 RepID=UPI000E6E236F|nr:clavesin-1-like [Ctenocephalides felis]
MYHQPVNEGFAINTSAPGAETMEIAVRELRETPEVRQAAIVELRQLLSEAKDLCYRDDDEFLVIFLRPCKFYAKSALELMRRIAQFRKDYNSILDNLMPEDERVAFCDNDVVNVLTNRDQLGRRVLIVNAGGKWDPKKVSSDQMFRMFYLIHEAAMLEPETQIRGVVCIMDFEGLGMKQVTSMSPAFSMRLLSFIQDAMPLRMKEVHFVKQPLIFNMVWKMFQPFVKEKLRKRLFFHGSKMEELHKYISPSHLPQNYKGQLPSIDYGGKDWYPVITKYEDHIRKWNSYGFSKK